MENAQDYELFHYGVKGMKWGVRRKSRESSDSSNSSTPSNSSPKRRINKKKLAIGIAAGVGTVAVAGLAVAKVHSGRQAVVNQIVKNGSKSIYELAMDVQNEKRASYTPKARSIDARLFGAKAVKRIEKKHMRNTPLKDARVGEAKRTVKRMAAQAAINVAVSAVTRR